MSVQRVQRPAGYWADVISDGGHVWAVYSVSGAVVCEREWVEQWRVRIPGDYLRFTRSAIDGERVYGVGQSLDQHAWLVTNGLAHDLGPAVGTFPVAFGRRDGSLCVWVVYALGNPIRYRIIRVSDGVVIADDQPGILTSQGIRDIAPDSSIVWGDPTYNGDFGGHHFNQYQKTDQFIVGQSSKPDGIGCLVGSAYWIALQTNGAPYGVHGTMLANQTLIVCGYSDSGANFLVCPTPYPVAVVEPPSPSPSTPPPPQPQPQPEPKSMTLPLFPDGVTQLLDRFVTKYPVPTGGPNPSDDTFENRCRAWVKAFAEQVVFSTNDPSWGVKNAGGGRPQSKDSLARQIGGLLVNYDLLSGVGTGSPTLIDHPSPEDISEQTFVPVTPINHLAEGPIVIPAPDPTSESTPDLSAVNAQIDALVAENSALKLRIEAVETKIAAIPDPATLVVKGSHITVSGPVSVKLPFIGEQSKTVTMTGSIQ